jgi:hypothetical protein
MTWEVEYTDEFEAWWKQDLSEGEQDEIAAVVGLLERKGPHLPYPYSSGVGSSQHPHLRELRIQYRGSPYRILYAFDPRRIAVLLIGGCKTGRNRWYEEFVPLADTLYDEHLNQLRKEGLIP